MKVDQSYNLTKLLVKKTFYIKLVQTIIQINGDDNPKCFSGCPLNWYCINISIFLNFLKLNNFIHINFLKGKIKTGK